MTITFFLLDKPLAVMGVKFPAGPFRSQDLGWSNLLRGAGATVISEKQYNQLTAEAAAKAADQDADATAPAMGVTDAPGTHNPDDRRRHQESALDSIKRHQSGRPYRRV